MNTETMLSVAKSIATNAFDKVKDKGGNPYIKHIEFVADRSVYYYGSITGGLTNTDATNIVMSVAYLHDLIEDIPHWSIQNLTEIFGNDMHGIAAAVKLLTKDTNMSYEENIKRLAKNNFSLAVKLADLEHNMDIKRLKVVEQADIERIKKYHGAYTFLMNQI